MRPTDPRKREKHPHGERIGPPWWEEDGRWGCAYMVFESLFWLSLLSEWGQILLVIFFPISLAILLPIFLLVMFPVLAIVWLVIIPLAWLINRVRERL